MRPLLAVALALALAGCSSSPPEAVDDAPQAAFEELALESTATTGIIRGIVVDTAIRPIAGASVTLRADPPVATTTTADGAFGFDGLESGTYFLSIHKVGFLDVQQSAEVVAGVAEPPIVKVQVVSDGKPSPYYGEYKVEGIIECGTSAVAACGGVHDAIVIVCVNSGGAVCLPQPTNDAYSAFLWLDGGTPDYIQTEMVWQSTQALSNDMNYALRYAERETYDNGMYEGGIDSFEGPSPLLGNISGEDAEDAELGNRTGLVFSIFSGNQEYPVGVTVEQRYTFFIHAFYGYIPPADWRFTEDGAPPPPA
jgi:Carboxypeptidase regulatory-like domain